LYIGVQQQPVAGQSLTLYANLSSGATAGLAPTGTMTFYDNDVAIPGTVAYTPVPGGLQGLMTYTYTTTGNHNLKVSYSGDTNYAPATSGETPITVTGPVSVGSIDYIVIPQPGESGTAQFQIVPNNGYTGTATVQCMPDPAATEASCKVTSGTSTGTSIQVSLSGSAVFAQVTVLTTAKHAALTGAPAPFGAAGKVAVAGLLVLMLPWMRRRRRVLLGMVLFALALGIGACGGGGGSSSGGSGGDPGTPTGSYQFSIVTTPTAGSNTTATTTPFVVLVQ
jgi:hypothetical protein